MSLSDRAWHRIAAALTAIGWKPGPSDRHEIDHMLDLYLETRMRQGRGVATPRATGAAFRRIALAASELSEALQAAESMRDGADATFMAALGVSSAEVIRAGLPELQACALMLAREAEAVAAPAKRLDVVADFMDRWAWTFWASRDLRGISAGTPPVDAHAIAFFVDLLEAVGRTTNPTAAKGVARRAKRRTAGILSAKITST